MTPRRQKFAAEFMADFNAADAARRAGFGAKSAPRYGKYLLRQAEVAAAIEARVVAEERTIRVTADRVLSELAALAFSDIRRFARIEDGKLALVPSAALAPGESSAIAFVQPAGPRNGARIRLHDKIRALRALMKHVGLGDERVFVDPVEQDRHAARVFARLFRAAGMEPPASLPYQDEAP
jgi:phage terminase small subunit